MQVYMIPFILKVIHKYVLPIESTHVIVHELSILVSIFSVSHMQEQHSLTFLFFTSGNIKTRKLEACKNENNTLRWNCSHGNKNCTYVNLLNNIMTYQKAKQMHEELNIYISISKISLTFYLFLLSLFGLHKEGSFLRSLQEVFLLEDLAFPANVSITKQGFQKTKRRKQKVNSNTDYSNEATTKEIDRFEY